MEQSSPRRISPTRAAIFSPSIPCASGVETGHSQAGGAWIGCRREEPVFPVRAPSEESGEANEE